MNKLPATVIFLITICDVILFYCFYIEKSKYIDVPCSKLFFLIAIVAFFASSFLYVLSGAKANIGSYDNRGLTSTWIALAILVATMFETIRFKRKKIHWVLFFFTLLVHLSFAVQVNNYIESWKLQDEITNQCIEKLQEQNAFNNNDEIIVIGDVPRHLKNNFNNEEIFNNAWDFGALLYLKSNGKISKGIPVTAIKIKAKNVYIFNDTITVDGYWNARITNLWYFHGNNNLNNSFIKKINNQDELISIIQEIEIYGNQEKFPYYRKITNDFKTFN